MHDVAPPRFALDRIKLQDTARLFRIGPDTIINRSGRSITISDTDGFVHAVLTALDGLASAQATYDSLPERFKQSYSLAMMLDIIRQLDGYKLFENVSRLQEQADLLSEYEIERWNRNFDFFNALCSLDDSKLDAQKRIRDARVVLLGVGGVGTHALLDLVSLGFTNIRAVDFDKVELSNLNRQILYGERDVGSRKIDAARDAIARYIAADRHNITFYDLFIDGPQAVYPLVDGADVVIGCVDRPTEVVAWINEACVHARVPFVSGGVDTTRTCTYTVVPGVSGCIECWRRHTVASGETKSKLVALELARDVMKLPPRPAIVNLVSIQVGFIMSEVLKIITGLCPPSATDKLIEFDFETMRTSDAETWRRDPDCPTCGHLTLRSPA